MAADPIIQGYIDNKEWKSLAKSDFLYHFRYSSVSWSDYTFEYDIFPDFFLNKERMEEVLRWLDNHAKTLAWQNVFKNIVRRKKQLDITLTVQDWKDWIAFAVEMLRNVKIDTYDIGEALKYTDKDENYYRALLDDKVYKSVIRAYGDSYSYVTNKIIKAVVDKLTDEECLALGHKLGFEGKLELDADDDRVLLRFFKSPKEAIKRLNDTARTYASVGLMISDLSENEFVDLFEDMTKDQGIIRSTLSGMCDYYMVNTDVPVRDTILDDIRDMRLTAWSKVVNNMSDAQLEKNAINMPLKTVVRSDKISLDKVSQLKGNMREDISDVKLFTENEIARNPHFFSPKRLSKSAYQYVSRETFTKLNKAWGMRQRYNNNLTNFSEILETLNSTNLSIDKIKYLRDKTNSSNETVVKALKTLHLRNATCKDCKNLLALIRFLDEYN